MCSSYIKLSFLGLVLAAAACGDDGQYEFGFNTTGIEFELFDPTEGIHPSKVTLNNPNNPFRLYGVSDETRFAILGDGGNAGAFYAWATLLTEIPIGENQFFTAVSLRNLYLSNEVAEGDLGGMNALRRVEKLELDAGGIETEFVLPVIPARSGGEYEP